MKKILLLGGSAQQVVAINTAKRLGYFTILCDYLDDNPGQFVADKFYLESTTNKEKILEIAKAERIDGILAYASDPAAPTAAYVAEKLHLPTNPFKSVNTLCNKDEFRNFLSANGFNTPHAKGFNNMEEVLKFIDEYFFPIIVKPLDSSGSKGATVLYSLEGLEKAVDFALSFSRCHRVIIEEFIEKKHPYLIGGDIFVIDGKIEVWGLLNCHRDMQVNPLVPVGKSYPLILGEDDVIAVKNTLQTMIEKLGIKFGSVNVELVVDKHNRVWPIDIGPRAGGNMIPDLLGIIFGIDLVEMAVLTAMGKKLKQRTYKGHGFYATHNLHSSENGTFVKINFSSKIEKYLINKKIYKKTNDKVEYFDNASKALGIIFMKFNTESDMFSFLPHISDEYEVVLRDRKEIYL